MKRVTLIALALGLLLAGGYVTAAGASHDGPDFWLHCTSLPIVCKEEPVPTVTSTSTATATVTTSSTATVTTTQTVTTTAPTTTATTATTAPSTTTAPPPPPAEPSVFVPDPVLPALATYVTPTTFPTALTSAPIDTTLVLTPGVYRGSYVVTRRLAIAGQRGATVIGRFRLQAAGAKLLGGIEIDGTGTQFEGVWIEAADVLVERMIIHNTYGDGIFGGGDRVTIRDNWLHHNGRLISTAGVPQKHGVYFTGGADALIANNVIELNQGHGVQVHPYAPIRRLRVTHNTILRNGNQEWEAHQGASGVIMDGSVADSTFDANIVAWNQKETGIRKLGALGANNTLIGNLSWLNPKGSCPLAATFASSTTFAFFCAGLVDGGANLEAQPFTTATRGYGSSLYSY